MIWKAGAKPWGCKCAHPIRKDQPQHRKRRVGDGYVLCIEPTCPCFYKVPKNAVLPTMASFE